MILRRIRKLCTKDSRLNIKLIIIRLLGRSMFWLLGMVLWWAWIPVGLCFICLDLYSTMIWTSAVPFSVWLQLDARPTNRKEAQISKFFYFYWSCTSIVEFMVWSVLSNDTWHTMTFFAVKEIALQNLPVVTVDSWLNSRN